MIGHLTIGQKVIHVINFNADKIMQDFFKIFGTWKPRKNNFLCPLKPVL